MIAELAWNAFPSTPLGQLAFDPRLPHGPAYQMFGKRAICDSCGTKGGWMAPVHETGPGTPRFLMLCVGCLRQDAEIRLS